MKKNNNILNFFKNKDGEWTIAQTPNFPIIAWFFLALTLQLFDGGSLKSGMQLLSSALLFTWAYLEITSGDSSFRRLLGGIVLLVLVYDFFS